MITEASLEAPPRPVVLDPIPTKRQYGAIVGVDRHLDVDLMVRLIQQSPYIVFDFEKR